MEASEQISEGGLTKQFREWRSRLSNAEFTVSRDRVFFRCAAADRERSGAGPRLIRVCARDTASGFLSKRSAAFATTNSIWKNTSPVHGPLANSEVAAAARRNAALALRAMHETGLLQIIIPVWEQIECLVVRDFYHRYTVDEHTLVTLEYLEELKATQRHRSQAVPRASRRNCRICHCCSWR